MQLSAISGIGEEKSFYASVHGIKLKKPIVEFTNKLPAKPELSDKDKQEMQQVTDRYLAKVQERIQKRSGRVN